MLDLLRVDFFKIIKNKLVIIMAAVCFALGVFDVLLNKGILLLFEIMSEDMSGVIGMSFQDIFPTAFSFNGSVGLIVPVVLGIIICLDETSGSLRNKIIIGKNRTSIYFSHLISSSVVTLALLLLYATGIGGTAALCFDATGTDWLKILYSVILGITGFLLISSFMTALALSTKSMPLTIIIGVILAFILNFAVSLGQLGVSGVYDNVGNGKYLLYLIPTVSSACLNFELIQGAELGFMVLEGAAIYLVLIVINTIVGLKIFKSKDLK